MAIVRYLWPRVRQRVPFRPRLLDARIVSGTGSVDVTDDLNQRLGVGAIIRANDYISWIMRVNMPEGHILRVTTMDLTELDLAGDDTI